MVIFENQRILSIGSSCINQFQIEYFFKRHSPESRISGAFFDWNITTPDSTAQFFQYVKAGTLLPILQDRANYVSESGRLKNTAFHGLYFWHEDTAAILGSQERFAGFSSKVTHLLGNFLGSGEGSAVHLLWSNVQPNLRQSVFWQHLLWGAFRLTEARYQAILDGARSVFGAETTVTFISRHSDADPALARRDNLVLLDLPRMNLLRKQRLIDYRGDSSLYEPVFRKLLQPGPIQTR